MENREYILNELKELSPRLAKMEKINPFTVPPNYFETLPQIISEKIKLQKRKSFDWNLLIHYLLKPQYSLSLAILAVVIIFFVKTLTPEISVEKKFDKLTADELQEYIQKNIDDYEEGDLGLYCCVNMNSSDFLFNNQKEQDEYIEKNLLDNLKEEEIL